MLRADLYDYSDAYIVVKGVQIHIMQKKKKKELHLKIMLHLSTAF